MIRVRHRTFAAVTFAIFAAAGCNTPPKPVSSAPPAAPWTAPPTRVDSTAQLEPLADQFDLQVGQLPGVDGTDHRTKVVDSLATLVKILQLANGPDQSPAFANRLAVVEDAQKTLGDQTIPRSRMEAVENQAMIASADALDEVSTRYLFDDDKLPDLVKATREKVAAEFKSQGPMHDLDVSNSLGAVRALVREETDALIERFGSLEARTRLAQRNGTPPPVAPAPAEVAPPTPVAPAVPTPAPTTAPTTAPVP